MSNNPSDYIIECPYCYAQIDERFSHCPKCDFKLWDETGLLNKGD